MVNNQFLYKKLNWEPAEFTPISMVASAGMVLVVHPSVPATTIDELVVGPLETARAEDELLAAVVVPAPARGEGRGYEKAKFCERPAV